VLTEHRKFDAEYDYSTLSTKYGVRVLKGSELDTSYGHFLVYGVNDKLVRAFDFSDITLDAVELMRAAREYGAIAIPAHTGRFGIGFCEYVDTGPNFQDVQVVEGLNGGSRRGENERAEALMEDRGYIGTGGSDAHFASAVGTCLTRFPGTIGSEQELVEALYAKQFRPVRLEETADHLSTLERKGGQ
jgi:predicted metal-dependent phosphoesterase TrpH